MNSAEPSTSVAQEAADQDAIARHVRYLTGAIPQLDGIDLTGWQFAAAADAKRIRAGIRRGELTISHQVEAQRWWEPVTRERADELTEAIGGQLQRWKAHYAEADATGRLTVTLWKGPRKYDNRPV